MSIHLPLLNAMFFIHFTSDHRIIARPFFFLISEDVGNYSLKSRKIKVLKKPIHDYLHYHGINVLADGGKLVCRKHQGKQQNKKLGLGVL